MRQITRIVLTLAFLTVLIFTQQSTAQKSPKMETGGMFMITSPHTQDECLKAMDELSSMGKAKLSLFTWGCMSGDHTSYGVVKAKSEADAKAMIPASVRGKAHVVKVVKLTQEQIKAFHHKS